MNRPGHDQPLGMITPLTAASIAYHRDNVAVLDHEWQRGWDRLGFWAQDVDWRPGPDSETAMVWAGAGAQGLGFAGMVALRGGYVALFAPEGPVDLVTGQRLHENPWAGHELVIAPSRSVGVLQVVGLVDEMLAIMDAERQATVAYLEQALAARANSTGLIYLTSRHRADAHGGPQAHDHLLLANLSHDRRGSWEPLDITTVYDELDAATITGRHASARKAVELGLGVEPDPAPSARPGDWAVMGVPPESPEHLCRRSRGDISDFLEWETTCAQQR